MSPASPSTPAVLLLWDIDHTLIETRGIGRAIYERAFPAATGKPLARLASIAGRTELDIMAESLRLNGIEPTDEQVAALSAALVHGYEDARAELHDAGRALPGADTVLAELAVHPAIHQTVLTGNLREVARIKLDVFDLAQYLDLASGAYGEDNPSRPALVAVAQRRARDRTGITFDSDHVVLVGDTPNDVQAGLAAGVHVVAVSTGKTTAKDLAAAGANVVADNLTECQSYIRSWVDARRTA
jgi:phosphoglycolate phosphatase